MRPARVRYTKRVFAAMAVYAIALFCVEQIFRRFHPVGMAAILLALLPALPVVAVVLVAALYFGEETDEVEKSLRTQAMLWGIGLTLSVATLWGFLESFGQVRHIDSYMAFPVFCLFTGLATALLRLRYR